MTAFPDHIADPETGLLKHKETGHLIGIEQAPPKVVDPSEFPKWVFAHASHVVETVVNGAKNVTVSAFEHWHMDRDTKKVKVLVHNAEEERDAVNGVAQTEKSLLPNAPGTKK